MPATTLNQQIQNLATQIGSDVKTLIANQGNLSALTTTQKASLVLSINELNAALAQIDKNIIDDAQTIATKTWSSNKILSEITTKCNEVKTALLGGAGEAFDTLKELADLIEDNKELIESLQELAGAHIRYDAAQELSPEQKSQARSNIGAADNTEYQATKTAVGTLTNLTTSAKTDLVSALNEVKGQADKGVNDAAAAKSAADAAQSTANTAKSTADTAEADVDALETAIGATDTDFVAVYTAARDGE